MVDTVEIIVDKNEEKTVSFLWTDQIENEFSVNARLVGEGARVTIIGMFLGTGDNKLIFNTSVIHEAPNTKSLTTIRGVFRDTSSFSNDGLVAIKRGAKAADGYFSSKILLFDEARGKSVPSLEIDENDLKAGHASTVGRPEPSQLFYLQSRGISEKQATELIVSGFFKPLLRLLPETDLASAKKRLSITLL